MLPMRIPGPVAVCVAAAGLACAAYGQRIITTIAGTDAVFIGNGIPALQARLSGSLGFGVTTDSNGVVYVADGGNHAIYKITPDGVLTTIAGNGIPGFSGDGGPATAASLLGPSAVAVGPDGSIYVADWGNHDVRKITPDGIITTIAGNGVQQFAGDGGQATAASISYPETIAVDVAGNVYVGSISDGRIRKITPDGMITTVAGNGVEGFSGDDGPATAASLDYPEGLAVDNAGNLYIADMLNRRIRKVAPDGTITTVAGGGDYIYLQELPAAQAAIFATALAFNADGELVFGDLLGNRVARLTSRGTIVTVAGNGDNGITGDGGPALSASLSSPTGVAVNPTGAILIADQSAGTIRKVSVGGLINTFAGNGAPQYDGDNGPAVLAKFNVPQGVALDSAGTVYIADSLNRRVRALRRNGTVVTVAGSGRSGFGGDGGPATSADFYYPFGVAVDNYGNLYVTDSVAGLIRKITPDGIITRIAGDTLGHFSGDGGPANKASLARPTTVKVDGQGNIYFADAGNNRIRRIGTNGIIMTLAGGGTTLGDGGPATAASLKLYESPSVGGGVAFDSDGNLYIADTFNHRIRKVTPGGIITTIAGTGRAGYSGDGGPAAAAQLNAPLGITVDRAGNIIIADQQNSRIRMISGGIITTVAGNGRRAFNGDGGPATNASLRAPSDVAVDPAGNIYIADQYSNRIREVLVAPPAFDVQGASLKFSAASGGAPAPPQFLMATSPIPGVLFSVSANTSSGDNWLSATPTSGAAPRLIEVVADPANVSPGKYQGTLTIESPNATPRTRTLPVTFEVTPGPPPVLSVDKRSVSFTFPRTATIQSEALTIFNSGGGTLEFNAATATATGGEWLKVFPASGKATPASSAIIVVTADATGLQPGTYSGLIRIQSASGDTRTVAVTMTISEFEKALALSQTGLSFTAVANGGVVPPQTFGILSTGNGSVKWSVSTSTVSGGPNWLSITPTDGRTDKGQPVPLVEVRVDPSGLAAGTYYGLVRVDYTGDEAGGIAANSPQMLTVALQVLPAGDDPGPTIQPAELTFTGVAGGDFPGAKEILVYNVSGKPLTFRSVISNGDDNFSISAPPRDGTVAPGQPARVVVQPRVDNLPADGNRSVLMLPPGVYTRELGFQFSDGQVRSVTVKLIVAPAALSDVSAQSDRRTASATDRRRLAETAGCAATKLIPSVTSLARSFSVSAGWPVALSVDVSDDCGGPVDDGFVSVSFSNGDPPVLLQSLKQGRWQGSWATQNGSTSQVTLTVDANTPDRGLRGTKTLTGNLQTGQDPPVTDKNTIVSAASLQSSTPVAPGGLITIFGERLAETDASADTMPLPTKLGTTEIVMAGIPVPLLHVSQNQVNAVVPTGLNANTSQQMLIRRGLTLSRPVSVDVAPAEPAVFVSGTRPMIMHQADGGSAPVPVSPDAPATAGEVVTVLAAGLGATDPAVPDGNASPSDPLARPRDALNVSIGGADAPVALVGLVPGSVGIYQVNVTIPSGLQAGEQPLVLTISGQSSPAVMVNVH